MKVIRTRTMEVIDSLKQEYDQHCIYLKRGNRIEDLNPHYFFMGIAYNADINTPWVEQDPIGVFRKDGYVLVQSLEDFDKNHILMAKFVENIPIDLERPGKITGISRDNLKNRYESGELYLHPKTGNYYKFLSLCQTIEDHEPRVLYKREEKSIPTWWTRDLLEFDSRYNSTILDGLNNE